MQLVIITADWEGDIIQPMQKIVQSGINSMIVLFMRSDRRVFGVQELICYSISAETESRYDIPKSYEFMFNIYKKPGEKTRIKKKVEVFI